jgi:hypothetical protein
MDYKLIRLLVEGSSCLNASNLSTMAKLSLRVRANDLSSFGEWDPLSDLLVCAQLLDGRDEQEAHQTEGASIREAAVMCDIFEDTAVVVYTIFVHDLSGPETLEKELLPIHVAVTRGELHVVSGVKGLLNPLESCNVAVEFFSVANEGV